MGLEQKFFQTRVEAAVRDELALGHVPVYLLGRFLVDIQSLNLQGIFILSKLTICGQIPAVLLQFWKILLEVQSHNVFSSTKRDLPLPRYLPLMRYYRLLLY